MIGQSFVKSIGVFPGPWSTFLKTNPVLKGLKCVVPQSGLQNFWNCIVTGILKEKCIPIFHVLGHVWNFQNCILDLHFYKDAFPTQCPLNLHINKVLSTYACWGDYKNKKLWFFLLESSKKNYFCSGQGKDKVKRPPSISSLSKNDSSQSPHCPKMTPLSLLTVQKWPPAISSLSENDPPQSQSWKKFKNV